MNVLVRHLPTVYNAQGLVRGQHDPPPTAEARYLADATADRFRGLPVTEVYSSDRQAASLLGEAISRMTKTPLTITPALRSWDLGDLQGRPVKDTLGDIQRYMRAPDTVPLGSTESWNTFVNRYLDFYKDHHLQPGYCVFVTHGRPIMVTRAWLSAGAESTLDDTVLDADYSTFVPHGGWVTVGDANVLDGLK